MSKVCSVCGKGPSSGTTGATRWWRRSAVSTRTCSACGSWSTAPRSASTCAPAASRAARSQRAPQGTAWPRRGRAEGARPAEVRRGRRPATPEALCHRVFRGSPWPALRPTDRRYFRRGRRADRRRDRRGQRGVPRSAPDPARAGARRRVIAPVPDGRSAVDACAAARPRRRRGRLPASRTSTEWRPRAEYAPRAGRPRSSS